MPFVHLPLGQRIPPSPHAVSASLPTMQDIRGYEQKHADTMRHVKSAYPRFVVHPFTVRLAAHFVATVPSLEGRTLWLTSTAAMADLLRQQLLENPALLASARAQVGRFEQEGIHGVSHPATASDVAVAAKTLLQNVGGFLSSRESEDHLLRLGVIASTYAEPSFTGDADATIRRELLSVLPGCTDADLLLANSGMNAVYTAFQAVNSVQAPRGRTVWIQLGWLYRDSIAILQRFTASPADYVYIRDVLDLETITRVFERFGDRIAGVFTELPTNPLIQMPDVAAISRLCRQHGARLILDPSVSSVFAVDVLSYADVLIASLTKYTASEGDLIGGMIAINPEGLDAAVLRQRCAATVQPLYARDRARLALEIGETKSVLARINANAAAVAAYLSKHPKVREVYWALHPASRDNYLRVARTPDATGGMITFTLRCPMEPVYDALRLPKGPSFGMKTTLICPFMYLAHFDLVSTPAGIAELGASHLDPELLRLCVGVEPVDEIIAALDEALAAG